MLNNVGPRIRSLRTDEVLCAPLDEPPPVEMLLPLPLIIRSRFLRVLHVQERPPKTKEGRQTSFGLLAYIGVKIWSGASKQRPILGTGRRFFRTANQRTPKMPESRGIP